MTDALSDFGGTSVTPLAIVRASVDEALAEAARRSTTVTVRGAGHSCGGQSLGRGVVLDLFAPGRVEVGQAAAVVRVPAGACWRDLELALNKRGWMIPVATDYLALSVGGTLSVGGFGFESIVRGSQVDHVAALRVRVSDGRTIVLRPDDELFRFVLGGLGRLAVIEEVELEVVPFRRFLRTHTRAHPGLRALAEAIGWVSDPRWSRPSTHFATQYWPAGPTIERVGDEHETLAALEAAPRPAWAQPEHQTGVLQMRRYVDHLEISRWVASFPDHDRVWCDFGLTHAALVRFVELVERHRRTELGQVIRAVYLAAVRAPPPPRTTCAFDLRVPGEPYTYTCGLYAMVPRKDPRLLARALAHFRQVTSAAIELGGRPYLYGRYELTAGDLRRCYGRDHARYLELKRELDPDARLASGATVL